MARGNRPGPERERTPEERERDRQERERRRALRTDGEHTPQPELEPRFAEDDEIGMETGAAVPAEPEPVSQSLPAHELPAQGQPGQEPDVSLPSAPLEPTRENAPEPALDPPPVGAEPPQGEVPEPVAPEPTRAQAPEPPLDPVAAPPVAPERDPQPPPPRRPALSNAALGLGPAPGRTHRPHAPRSGPARIGAVLALLAVLAAIVLVVRTLVHHSSHSKTVAAPKVIKVLVPEGKTRAQIAQIAKAAGLRGSYRLASRSSPLLDPRHYGAPADTRTLEGFLFPATYDANPGESVTRLVRQQLIAFRENIGASIMARARALRVSLYELLTIASMVEREAQVPGDRAKIAAVIYNRLKLGMPLGIDATIYYAVEQRTGVATYTHELSESQLHIDSPYNTRTHAGLPPTPISNPGLAAIEAAAHPTHASYLYYVAGADGCGEQVFSTTQAAFEANVAAYDAALRKNGGHPPSCKHGK